ncbi:MAG: hypothetical protein KDB32_06530 [Planctomycetes bacterium]|nr:hypothetical protein [Planctomycetota bacterium]
MRIVLAILTLVACGLPLSAQTVPQTPDPSAEKESFILQPASVERGAKNFAIRLVSNEPGGFSNSSSKPPLLTFGAGVTLVSGSFQLLNQNEAQCAVDVDNEVAGTIEVKLELFSVNGTATLKTLRATLGVTGTTPVGGSQAEVGAESVALVQVNSTDPQSAGVIVIKGAVAGSVSITAPTGCNFAELPTATIDNGDINSPALAQSNTVFNFSIGNVALNNVTVRVDGIKYNTQFFALAGGVEGALACEVTGAALSNQSALVVNAFTAKTTVEGSNDNTEPSEPAPATGSEESASTDTNSTTGGTSINNPAGNSRPLESSTNNRNNRNNRNTTNGNSGRVNRTTPARATEPRAAPGGRNNTGFRRNNSSPPNSGPGPSGGSGGGATNAGGTGGETSGTGYVSTGDSDAPEAAVDKHIQVTKKKSKKMQVTPGLHFCDKDFNPVTALVMDKSVSGEAGGRVWIMLKLKKDKHADKVETLTVKLSVNGTTRELVLTETGKNTAEFRCGKEGILVVANQNPDSNAEEGDETPPIPRYPR